MAEICPKTGQECALLTVINTMEADAPLPVWPNVPRGLAVAAMAESVSWYEEKGQRLCVEDRCGIELLTTAASFHSIAAELAGDRLNRFS
jgi:hypothetical protein